MHARPISTDQARANAEIARLLGDNVKAEWPAKYLDCATDRGPCWAKGDVSVLEVGEMLTDGPTVLMVFYAARQTPTDPGTFTYAVIELERRGKGWIGVRYLSGPTTRTRKK